MVKKSLLTFHHRQTLQELMWSGILRIRMSPVHNTKSVLSWFFPFWKASARPSSSPHFPYRKHKVPSTPWVYNQVWAMYRGTMLLFWDARRSEFCRFLVFCPLSCCEGQVLIIQQQIKPEQGRRQGIIYRKLQQIFFWKFQLFFENFGGLVCC